MEGYETVQKQPLFLVLVINPCLTALPQEAADVANLEVDVPLGLVGNVGTE